MIPSETSTLLTNGEKSPTNIIFSQSSQFSRMNPLPHLHTLYLLVASDLKTTLLPATVFALVASISGDLLTSASPVHQINSQAGLHSHDGHHQLPSLTFHMSTFLPDIARSIAWTLINLLIFNLANQRLPNSILEDQLNKPYRAIPSGRLSPVAARHLLLWLIPLSLCLSHFVLGARNEAMLLMVATWAYNDLAAGDEHFFIRHLLNALGFTTFGAGAAAVAIGTSRTLNTSTYQWLTFIAIAITFTMQFQDMEDQEGDSLRDRKTMPLVIGDALTRKINTVVIMVFSIAAPTFWRLSWWGYVVQVMLGSWIAARSWTRERGVKRDKVTFRLWCLWLMALYLLPLALGKGVLEGMW